MLAKTRHVVRLATVAMLAAAVLAPTADARRSWGSAAQPPTAAQQSTRPTGTCHQYCGVRSQTGGSEAPTGRSLVRTELVPRSDAFRWADGAIGFAVACIGVLLVLVIVGAARRTRIRRVERAS